MMLVLQPLAAQFVHISHDARRGAMGGVFLLDTARRVELAYRQDFMLAGMADKRAAVVLPVGRLGVAEAEYNHHGDMTYHEQQASLGYMLRVGEWLRVGVQGRWMNIGVGDAWYESRQWLGADAMAVANVERTEMVLSVGTRPYDDERPWRAFAQMAYRPSTEWLTAVAIESDDCLRLRCGMEYSYEKLILFRAGMSTNPLQVGFGVGVRYGSMRLDIGAETQSTLGVSPCISVAICF